MLHSLTRGVCVASHEAEISRSQLVLQSRSPIFANLGAGGGESHKTKLFLSPTFGKWWERGVCPHIFGTYRHCTTHADVTSYFGVCKNGKAGGLSVRTQNLTGSCSPKVPSPSLRCNRPLVFVDEPLHRCSVPAMKFGV